MEDSEIHRQQQVSHLLRAEQSAAKLRRTADAGEEGDSINQVETENVRTKVLNNSSNS